MRYISIDMVKPGMRLAYPILDPNNRVLLGTHSVITEHHIWQLQKRGYAGLYIEDKLSEDIIIEESIPAELKNLGVKALRTKNIDAALKVAEEIAERLMNSEKLSLDLLDLRSYDDYTYKHSVNVCVLATVIGIALGLKSSELVMLSSAAMLHDIGKLQIDPQILNKPERLTTEEFEIVKKHAELSYEILCEQKTIPAMIAQGVLYHHENENGSGYPSGLQHNQIPLFSKIIHVVDVYDALTSRRPYKKPYWIADAIEYLMGGCDILFDEKVVSKFLQCVPVYPKGTTVKMSDGREAIVIENTTNPMRPKIRFEDGSSIDLNLEADHQSVVIAPSMEVELDFSDNPVLFDVDAHSHKEKKTILVVDDIVSILQNIGGILEKKYRLILLKSGKQAIQYLQNNPMPDLIIMDIDMPAMDGVETVRCIRNRFSQSIPVIFLTAITDRDTVLQCREVNTADYIVKPCRPVYVLERVNMTLNGSRCR